MRLLYLHGVGDDGTRRDWWSVLRSIAGDPLDDIEVLAPDYSDLLSGDTPVRVSGLPPMAFPHPPLLSRRSYRARQSALHADLMAVGAGSVWPYRRRGFGRVPDLIDAVGERFVMDVIYDEVNRYTREERLRRAVRMRVEEMLPPSGRVVILGHSLGALVAIDLVRHLPDGVDVPLLVTAASALARRRLPGTVADLPHTFPYDRVGGWINVFNPSDAVTRGRPIGMQFPQAIDVVAAGSLGDHSLATCVTEPGVAKVLLDSLRHPGHPHHTETLFGDEEPLPLPTAAELVSLSLVQHIAELSALEPRVKSESVRRFEAARQLVILRAAKRTGDTVFHANRDPGAVVHERLAEPHLPAALVRIVLDDPLGDLNVTARRRIVAEARRRVAMDIGIPPDWLELARACLKEARTALPRRERRRVPARPSPRAIALAGEIDQSLAPLGLIRTWEGTSDGAIGDITPACTELVARALVAGRLGQPDPGTEERAGLNRALLLLGDAKARAMQYGDQALADQATAAAEAVGGSLTYLARRGLGIGPSR